MVLVRRSNERTLSPFLIRRVTCTGEHALECYLIGECRITKRDTDGMIDRFARYRRQINCIVGVLRVGRGIV